MSFNKLKKTNNNNTIIRPLTLPTKKPATARMDKRTQPKPSHTSHTPTHRDGKEYMYFDTYHILKSTYSDTNVYVGFVRTGHRNILSGAIYECLFHTYQYHIKWTKEYEQYHHIHLKHLLIRITANVIRH